MRLKEKNALITGGGTGIGQGIALAFVREGCRVALAGRREEALRQAAALWKGEPSILWRQADVANRSSVEALFAWAANELGPIDILVNAAGINIARRATAALDPADWDAVLAINTTGAFDCMRAVLPGMRERKDGLIINISSIAGKRAMPLGGVAYNASKFAMGALGTTVGLEEAKNGIRVTTIYPGEVDTPLLDRRPVPVSSEHRAGILQPEDVGAAVLMIATLPPRAHVPELIIKPATQVYA